MNALFLAQTNANPSSGATNYANIDGAMSWNATENVVSQVIPHALTLDKLHIKLAGAPGSGKSLAFTVMKNGSATSLTVNVQDTNTSAKDDTHSVSFAAGDTISLRCVPTSTPTLPSGITVVTRQNASGQFAILFALTSNQSATTFLAPVATLQNTTEAQAIAPIPIACTIKNLYTKVTTAPGSGTSWTFTVRKNLADTSPALTCAIADANTTANDTTNAPTYAAGDRIAIHAVVSGAVAASTISGGMTVVPNVTNEACLLMARSNTASTSATNYAAAESSGSGYNSSEAVGNPESWVLALTLTGMFVRTSAAPGTGKSYTTTVRKNATTDTAVTVVISDAATTGSITGQSVALVDDDLIDVELVPASTPAAGRVVTGIIYTMVSAQTIVAGQATETDISQPMSKQKIAKPPQVIETDIAQPMGHAKIVHIGQAVETDIAQPMHGRRYVALGQAVETDIAQALSYPVQLPVRTAAGPLMWEWGQQELPRTILIGQAVETDTAGSFQQNRFTIGQATELDTAASWVFSISKIRQIGQVVETDTAGAMKKVKGAVINQAFENDVATKFTITGGIPATGGGGLNESHHRRLIRAGLI